MGSNNAPPDPPLAPTPSAKQSLKDANGGTLKKISGGGPNFSGENATTKGIPHPNNPYKG